MRKKTKIYCYWENTCGNYTCCHRCNSKNCIHRCTDNEATCKYLVDFDKSTMRHKQSFSIDKVENINPKNYFNEDTKKDNCNSKSVEEQLKNYDRIESKQLPSTLECFSTMIKKFNKIKAGEVFGNKPGSTIYEIILYKHFVIDTDKIYARDYPEISKKLRAIKKQFKK